MTCLQSAGLVKCLMTAPNGRQAVLQIQLREPRCPLPRPGEYVIWYEDMLRQGGKLLGTTDDGRPYILRDEGERGPVDSFAAIRAADPEHLVSGPIWQSLPQGRIYKPTAHELEQMERLAEREVPPGVSHSALANEIWLHGFEVFLTGPAVRGAIAGGTQGSVELVTTMPLDRLRRIIVDMYGATSAEADPASSGSSGAAARVGFGDLAQRIGRITFGGLPGSADPYATARPFRYGRRTRSNSIAGAAFIFGADFQHDMEFGDFACNAVYYDPVNKVFFDPSGHGLDDIATRCLRLVLKRTLLTRCEQAYVGLRIVRHYLEQDTPCDGQREELLELVQGVTAMRHVELASALDTELFSCFQMKRSEIMEKTKEFFEKFGIAEIWQNTIQPCLQQA